MHILITAGPTREYLDDVRYLSNASSGKMGYALAEACLKQGHQVTLVSGPVDLKPPVGVLLKSVMTTAEMLQACQETFSTCDGVIAAAAVCDYRPKERITGKLSKTGDPVSIEMIETDDVLASLGKQKTNQWILGFALEAQNPRENALQKLRRKNCDWIVLNAPTAIASESNSVELLGVDGETIKSFEGLKTDIAQQLVATITDLLS